MRKFIITAIATLCACIAFASDNTKLMDGNAQYSAENFDKAIEDYELLLKTHESAAAYYNLGNAYYKKGQLANAILNYERASLLDPNDEDIKNNLELARMQTIDKIETVEPFIMSEWWQTFRNLYHSNGWAVWSIALFLLTLTCVALYMYVKNLTVRKIGLIQAFVFAAACILCMVCAKQQKDVLTVRNHAIITSPSVTVKTSPEENAKDFFLLHEGTKVKTKQTVRKWVEIELEDGNVGWIKETDLEKI